MNTKYEKLYEGTIKNFTRSALTAGMIGATALSAPDAEAVPKTSQPISKQNQSGVYSRQEQQNIIARTLWAEARNDGDEGMKAVGSVIYNRGKQNPEKMINAIKSRKQFSCWNKMTSSDWQNFKIREKKGRDWSQANIIADLMLNGSFTPTTQADHYYQPHDASPYWRINTKTGKLHPYTKIGSHFFMKLGRYPTR